MLLIFLKHLITACILLTIPISNFAGFISLHFGLFWKVSLWSFSVIKDWFWCYCSILSSKLRSFAVAFASVFIEFIADTVVFLYVLLMFSISNLLYSPVVNTLIKLHPHIIMHLNSLTSMKIFNSYQHPLPRRNCDRKIIWFNPPYSVNVKTNIGRVFLCLIDKPFPQHHKYCKLFNRNNIKISHSCMPNMASVIWNHNISLLKDPTPTDLTECSCRQKTMPIGQKVLIWISSVRFSWLARH